MPFLDRVRNVWNTFRTQPDTLGALPYSEASSSYGGSSPGGSARSRFRPVVYSERSIVSSIYTRIAIDVSSVLIKHVQNDEQGRFKEIIDSPLNRCLTYSPNLDQTPRSIRQDIAMTLFDKGVAFLVPVDASVDPNTNEVFDVFTLRVGEIVKWYPKHVQLSVYNENKGKREDVVLPKRSVAVIENPLYSVMNEPNSTLQRLIRKLGLLDAVDEQSSSGKLDMIIQLPYTIKSEARKEQAVQRRNDIEVQLRGSQYGIAYIDGTEKITQLNRPAENNLLKQVEYLTALLYNQLGLTEEVMNGTATEEAMINYINRTVEPIMDAMVESMQVAFLGPAKTANNEKIQYFRDPFKLVPVKDIAEIADKFTRNEILSSNEMRGVMGYAPHPDPAADKLRNSNVPQPGDPLNPGLTTLERTSQNGS